MDEIKESGESHAEVSGPIRSRSTKHLQSKKKGSIIMLKKRLMSMFLALTMVVGLGSQVFAINATPASQIYSAQISHAAGIDEYGSNIRERSEILSED